MSIRLPILQHVSGIAGVERPDLCARCGGDCCQWVPGASSPSDFFSDGGKFDQDLLLEALGSGDWVIAHWDGDPRRVWDDEGEELIDLDDQVGSVYYPRPQFKNRSKGLYEDRWPWDGNGCNFLTETGCKLTFEKRPYGCRTLVPRWDADVKEFDCSHEGEEGGENQRAALSWMDYQEELFEVARAVEPGGKW